MKNIVHWCKPKKMWSSHTYKSCAKSPVILIVGDWHTETKPERKTNPRGWVVAEHTQVTINPPEDVLNRYIKTERVVFDKEQVSFNHNEGTHILFDGDGCFLVKERVA